MDTLPDLPDVNGLIGAPLTLAWKQKAIQEDSVPWASLILSSTFDEVYKDSKWCKILDKAYCDWNSCGNFVERHGKALIIDCAKKADYTELFSEQGLPRNCASIMLLFD